MGACKKALPAKAIRPTRSPGNKSSTSCPKSSARARRVGITSVANMLLEVSMARITSRPREITFFSSYPHRGSAKAITRIPQARSINTEDAALFQGEIDESSQERSRGAIILASSRARRRCANQKSRARGTSARSNQSHIARPKMSE